MQLIEEELSRSAEALVGALPNLMAAAVVLLVAFLLGSVAGRGVERLAPDGDRAQRVVRIAKTALRWAFVLLGLVLALQVLGLTAVATSLLATGGFAAVVMGFAFREIGENLLAGLMLGISRSFEVGDLIESCDYTGEVKDIELRHVHIRTSDGRDVFIPSAAILRNVLVNLTKDGLRRGDFVLGIDYGSSLEDALRLVYEAARSIPEVLDEPRLTVRVEEFEAQYVALRILFWVNIEAGVGLATVRSRVMQACLGALRDAGVTVSADVSSALTVAPLEVRIDG